MTGAGVRLADQGFFWVGVEFADHEGQAVADGTQLYVEYQVPETQTQPYPVVLIHGGGGQSLDWISTPDGRPGWRTMLLQRGYAVYLVDRPGHGRSPRTLQEAKDQLPTGLVPSLETLGELFAGSRDSLHTQWPGSGAPDDPALAQLLASQRQTPFDLAGNDRVMRERGGELLDRIGPAIVVTSSAGGPSGWQLADARPELVRAIVALEPLGPGGLLPLAYGLSAAPLDYEPRPVSAAEFTLVDVATQDGGAPLKMQQEPARQLPNLVNVPIAIVTAERSFANTPAGDAGTVAFLRQAGCLRVDHLVLPELGIHGNGHLMMIERNNDMVLDIVTGWIGDHVGDGAVSSGFVRQHPGSTPIP